MAEKRQVKFKALGDERHIPTSQDMGTLIMEETVDDIHLFKRLARTYVIEGADRTAICSQNAQVCSFIPNCPLQKSMPPPPGRFRCREIPSIPDVAPLSRLVGRLHSSSPTQAASASF